MVCDKFSGSLVGSLDAVLNPSGCLSCFARLDSLRSLRMTGVKGEWGRMVFDPGAFSARARYLVGGESGEGGKGL